MSLDTQQLAHDIVWFIAKSRLRKGLSRLIPDVEFIIRRALWKAEARAEEKL